MFYYFVDHVTCSVFYLVNVTGIRRIFDHQKDLFFHRIKNHIHEDDEKIQQPSHPPYKIKLIETGLIRTRTGKIKQTRLYKHNPEVDQFR